MTIIPGLMETYFIIQTMEAVLGLNFQRKFLRRPIFQSKSTSCRRRIILPMQEGQNIVCLIKVNLKTHLIFKLEIGEQV